jgi:chaperonin GroEL
LFVRVNKIKMHRLILNSEEAREALQRGVNKVANAVSCTLGPKGRNVIIQSQGGPIVTKDGVTVAKNVELECPYEDLGAQLCKQVSAKTNDVAGDGTTTATVLAQALVNGGLKFIASGGNAISVKLGMEIAVNRAVKAIEEFAKPIENKEQITFVATISGNEKEVGEIVADAMEAVGKDGVITIEESRGRETSLSLVEGMKFDKGYVSAFFVNNPEKMQCRHNDPFILLYDGKISDSSEILPILTKVNEQKKPVVIVADSVDGPALQMLVINVHKGAMPWVAVKTPGFAGQKKEYLYDIAALTGADVISSEMGTTLENCTIENLGKAKSVIINKESTTIIGGEGDDNKIEDRISQLKVTLSQVESDYEARILNERIAKLSGGVAIIKVGASTEAELVEKKYRYEDALAATRAAVEEGIVPGGGVTLLRISEKLVNDLVEEDQKVGFEIVKRALKEPIRQIASNAGLSADVVVETISGKDNLIGLDARNGTYVSMLESGIIDPAKVTRSALQNAVSIAVLVLTTETLIVDKPVDSEKVLIQEGAF